MIAIEKCPLDCQFPFRGGNRFGDLPTAVQPGGVGNEPIALSELFSLGRGPDCREGRSARGQPNRQ
jgi:hypothetical protein